MSNLMYFGAPGAIAEVWCPESGMGFVDNVDTEVTELVSGGRSVYRAPTTYRTFSMSWSANSQKLRHLIDTYNGQFGNGPFYLTDPTADQSNVLPARWSNAWQLAHQANGWCKPVVQEWPMAVTPAITDYRTPYRLVLTQDLAGSLAPVEGVLKTRVIRIPGKPYYFAAKGAATGGAGIRIRGFNASSNTWTLLTTFTTFTGVVSNVLSTANTTYSMIELDFYMPLGSTLTLYGMSLGTQDYNIPGEITNTNYAPNPRGNTGANTYWNVSAGTGGTASVIGYDTLYPFRKNYAQNPQATSTTRFATYTSGTGEVATQTFLTGQTDGPVADITNYCRITVTTPKTGGSTGILSGGGAQRNPLKGVTGEAVTVSMWMRYTGPGTLDGRLRASCYTSVGGTINSSDAPTVTLTSGNWIKISSTLTAADNFFTIGWWFYHLGAQIIPAGGTLDCTGVLIEKTATAGTYFDGNFPQVGDYSYLWEGTAHNSISQERLPAKGPDGKLGFIRYQQDDPATGGSVGGYMRDTTGYNAGVAGDIRYVRTWVRVNMPRQIRISHVFKTAGSIDVGPTTATPFQALQPGIWYQFDSGLMTATGTFARFQVWPNTVASAGVPLPPEFTADMITQISDKPIEYYFDGFSANEGTKYYHWTGAAGISASIETDHEAFDYMPVGNGVGAVQMTSSLGGTLVSAVIDRIGLTLDFTEVQNVESRMM